MATRLEAGKVGPPSRRNRSTEVPRSVHRSRRVGRPKSPSRSTEAPLVGRPSHPSRSTENAKGVGYLLIRPAKLSDPVRTVLRPPLSDSPPYPKQLSALLLITLRLTLMQVRRRFSSSKAESPAIYGGGFRQAGRRESPPVGGGNVGVLGGGISAGRRAQVGRLGWYRSARQRRPCRQADPFHTGVPTSRSQPAENAKGAG